jgi:hypothetical protein
VTSEMQNCTMDDKTNYFKLAYMWTIQMNILDVSGGKKNFIRIWIWYQLGNG